MGNVCPLCADSRSSCAADGGHSDGFLSSHACRLPAGYRSPKVLVIVPSRAVLREPQVVEQLVEVPTVLSCVLLQQRSAEQIVDIPVPRGRGRVVKVFSLDRLQQRPSTSRPLTFLFRDVVGQAAEASRFVPMTEFISV